MQIGPGTRVLVTGASRGIGAAVADAFTARGCEVGRVSRSGEALRPEPLAEAIVGSVEKGGREVFYPRNVRLLRMVQGLNPADIVLRRMMDRSAAP